MAQVRHRQRIPQRGPTEAMAFLLLLVWLLAVAWEEGNLSEHSKRVWTLRGEDWLLPVTSLTLLQKQKSRNVVATDSVKLTRQSSVVAI
jgi:hypothetical protein